MADSFIGRWAYAYINGSAVVHLKDWSLSMATSLIAHDPDIGSTFIPQSVGFGSFSGSVAFNLTSDDFAALWDIAKSPTAAGVPLYLYPHSTASSGNKMYLYGNVAVSNLQLSSTLLGTSSGSFDFGNIDGTGLTRAERA